MTARVTPTGWLMLGLVLLLYGASITSQSGLLLVPAGILLGCCVMNVVLAARALRHLEVTPRASVHVVEGQRLGQPWHVRNRGETPVVLVSAHSAAGVLFLLPCLGPGAETSLVPELQFQRRGVYEHDQLQVMTSFPFGLLRVARRLALAGEVVVQPAVYPVMTPRAAGFDVMVGGKFRGHRQTGAGDHFSGVRPQQPGDSLRQIHWASSAKGLGLMVKVFDEELSGRVAIVLDCGSSGDPTAFDDAVRAAGSLVFAALDAGHHVEWLDLATLEPDLIPPFADGLALLNRLARLTAEPASLAPDRMRAALDRLSRKCAVHLVLTQMTASARDAAAELRASGRHVTVYLPAGTAAQTAFAGTPTWKFRAHGMEEVS